MSFTFTVMDEADAKLILTWQYQAPYTIYSMSGENGEGEEDSIAEMLDRRSPYYRVRDEQGELVGFFNFGTSALVWNTDHVGIYIDDRRTTAIGLGMRPDLTGKGLGQKFVEEGLAFAKREFAPAHFVLYVYAWNERAIRVYERVGFQHMDVFKRKNGDVESEFLKMRNDV